MIDTLKRERYEPCACCPRWFSVAAARTRPVLDDAQDLRLCKRCYTRKHQQAARRRAS